MNNNIYLHFSIMGVPRLQTWIVTKFPSHVQHFQSGTFKFTVDYLYIDGNGLLHAAAQMVCNYGAHKRMMDPYVHLSLEEKYVKIYEVFFQMLLDVTATCQPTQVFYLAIDGPAPMAKQAQQRQRRAVAAKDRVDGDAEVFDSNCITPGTIFMHNLTKYLNYAIRKEMMTNVSWKNLTVYFSPPTEPGEGEHKCIDHMRKLPESERNERSFCMYGPDGDLIMLTLSVHLPQIYLLKEDQFETGYLYRMNMGAIRKELPRVLNSPQRSPDDCINDFVYLGFFVGNDFVTKLQMFYLLEDGLNLMLEEYTNARQYMSRFPLTSNKNIRIETLIYFISILEKYEAQYIEEQSETKGIVKILDPRFRDSTLEKHISPKTGKLHFEDYRRDYYRRAGIHDERVMDAYVHKMCAEYVHTLTWIYLYYVDGLPSWSWYYPWHYPPLLKDVLKYLSGLKSRPSPRIPNTGYLSLLFDGNAPGTSENSKDKDGRGKPSVPFVQLLCVLSPKSAYLLPKHLRHLSTDPKSQLVKLGYYPSSFNIDYEGKLKEHMGIVLLPFVDINVVREEYEKASLQNKTKFTRNELSGTKQFKWSDTYKSKYTSEYGTLLECKIKRTEV